MAFFSGILCRVEEPKPYFVHWSLQASSKACTPHTCLSTSKPYALKSPVDLEAQPPTP